MGFRATLNFRKFKVTEPHVQNFFLTLLICALPCLLNDDNIKKFHHAIFEL